MIARTRSAKTIESRTACRWLRRPARCSDVSDIADVKNERVTDTASQIAKRIKASSEAGRGESDGPEGESEGGGKHWADGKSVGELGLARACVRDNDEAKLAKHPPSPENVRNVQNVRNVRSDPLAHAEARRWTRVCWVSRSETLGWLRGRTDSRGTIRAKRTAACGIRVSLIFPSRLCIIRAFMMYS